MPAGNLTEKRKRLYSQDVGSYFIGEKDHDQQSDGPIQSVLRRKICLDIHRHKKLDTDFIRANPDLKIDYHYIDQLSPRHLLEFITARLNETV